MKKTVIVSFFYPPALLALFIFFSPAFLSGTGGDPPFPVYLSTKSRVIIDGSDLDWPVALPVILESDSQIAEGSREQPGEFYAHLKLFFDSQNLYIFGSVCDPGPLQNPFQGNHLYKGDSLEFYLGLRKQVNLGPFSSTDFESIIGFDRKESKTFIYKSGRPRKIRGAEIRSVLTEKGYNFEARIPLDNYSETPVKEGSFLWLDFIINNKKSGENDRKTMLTWKGGNTTWFTPARWQRVGLYASREQLEKVYILAPEEFFSGEYNRIYIYYRGKPWQGEVLIDSRRFYPDARGGISINDWPEGSYTLTVRCGGVPYFRTLTVSKKPGYLYENPLIDRLYTIISLLFAPLLVLAGYLFYRYSTGKKEPRAPK